MEPAEDASLEPAIQWLAQSILASPLIDRRDPWVREAGLTREMAGLKSEIRAVQLVVSVIKGRALGNDPLSESLVELKELLYDADDAVDELDYWRLLQLDQRGTGHDPHQTDGHHGPSQADRSMENADVPIARGTVPDPHETDGHGTQLVERSRGNAAAQRHSVGKLRSKLWKEFEIIESNQKGAPVRAKCIHCETELGCPTKQGTGVLQNHLKSKACPYDPLSTADATTNPAPVATGNLSSKKRRRDEESARLITANTNPWNKDDFSMKILNITLELGHTREGLIPVLSLLGSDFAASSNHSQGATSDQRRRTTGTLQGIVYGRSSQLKEITDLMEKKKFDTGATVLPILGIAGVGKTAVAQLVYNDPVVKDQFDYLLWIWVSNSFDAIELTKDMLACVSQETYVGQSNFTKLQETLESRIKSKRILLVLDDVWDGITDYEWKQLLAPLNSNNARGNMVIVTTRKPCVAKRRGTVVPIKLEALESDDFWLCFEARAFGDVDHEKRESLRELGEKIARQLKGNPLAAETAGALLSEHHTVGHWTSILMNEDWKSLKLNAGIMSALKLCYDRLPYHLQKCFTYCSLFPDKYRFFAEKLVRIWISQGFVKCNNSSKRLEEIGQDYLDNLVNLGFFVQLTKTSSPGCYYVMYNLMHDFGRVVSRTECATIDGLQCNRMFPTVRHLSIISHSISPMEDQTGNIARREKFEEILHNTIPSVGKLRSLVLIGRYVSSFSQLFQAAFQKAHNLRLLHLSTTSADFCSYLCNLVYPANLRYVTLETGHAQQVTLPQVLRNSFHLQLLCVNQHKGAPQILSFLERLRCLKRLKLSSIPNVTEVSVPSLEVLVLYDMPKLKTCTSVGVLKSSLKVLKIESCPVLEVLDLFHHNSETEQNSWLPSLKKLIICDCPNLHAMIPLPPSTTNLEIQESNSKTLIINPNSIFGECLCEIILDEKFLSFHSISNLQHLEIKDSCILVSTSLRFFSHLRTLKSLKIKNCKKLFSSDGDLIPSSFGDFPSLECLHIESCEITGKWLYLMLWHSPTLKELYLDNWQQLTQLQIEEDKNMQSNLRYVTLETDHAQQVTLPQVLRNSLHLQSLYVNQHNGAPQILSFRGRLRCLTRLKLSSMPNVIEVSVPSLEVLVLYDMPKLKTCTSVGDLTSSLSVLKIEHCPVLEVLDLFQKVHHNGQENGLWLLPQSLEELVIGEYSHETLRPCYVDNLTHLKTLEVIDSSYLKSLQLDSCTAMEYLRIHHCSSLVALEGLRSLVNLRELDVFRSPVLAFPDTSAESLESLCTTELTLLTTSFFEGLTSLRTLSLEYLKEERLPDEQERALLLHGSLQELVFLECSELVDLPAGLHSLPSLKTLKIKYCKGISGLPKEGLPPSLEELEIGRCSNKLSAQCRSLATERLRVKINGRYVN